MTTALVLSFINRSTLPEARVEQIAKAVGKQLAEDVAPIYGIAPGVEYVPPGATPSVGSAPMYFENESDIPGAAGYHYEDENGTVIGKVFVLDDWCDITASHEALEISQDAAANRWADRNDGTSIAFELCDPVEGDKYEKTPGVWVSNFVYPAWFDPNAGANEKFDHMGLLSAPGTMTPEGYMIVRTEPGKVKDVFAKLSRQYDGHHVHEAKKGLFLVFGKNYPDYKKLMKIEKALRFRGRKV